MAESETKGAQTVWASYKPVHLCACPLWEDALYKKPKILPMTMTNRTSLALFQAHLQTQQDLREHVFIKSQKRKAQP